MDNKGTNVILAVSMFFLAMVLAIIPIGGETSPDQASESCKGCHDEFVPFEVTATAPDDLVPGQEAILKVRVSNPGGHEVEQVSARVVGPNLVFEMVVDEGELSGTVSRTASSTQDIDVGAGAIHMEVRMSESSGPIDLTDAMLTVVTPAGERLISNTGGPSETVVIETFELMRAGPGTFDVIVEQVQGLRSMTYLIEYQVEYADLRYVIALDPIGPGEEVSGRWNLTLTKDEAKDLEAEVIGLVKHDHGEDGGERSEIATEKAKFRFGSGSGKGTVGQVKVKDIRNGLGYVLVGIFVVSIFTGWPRTRRMLPGLRPKVWMKVHCYLSWTMVLIIAVHAYIATTTHALTHPAVVTGFMMASVFVLFSIAPYFKRNIRGELKVRLGKDRFVIAVMVALLVLWAILGYHIVA